MEHCIAASVQTKGDEWGFTYCLTCKKGIMQDCCEPQGSRWMTNHAKKSACKQKHSAALEQFIQRKNKLSESIPTETVVSPPAPLKISGKSSGWVYCFTNNCMPGLVKVGMTMRPPEMRLEEANKADTWKPLPFEMKFAKRVFSPSVKEKKLHQTLSIVGERVSHKREFFRVSLEIVKSLFELLDEAPP
jgi:hypothetical protein